jgi:hypothetical protein
MGLLDGGLKNIINGALKGMAITIVFYHETTRPGVNAWEPAAKIRTQYSSKGFVTDYNERMIDGAIIQRGDKQIILLAGSCTVKPEPGDSVVVNGQTMTVINTATDPATAAYTLQVR